ncbi:MAG TPA: type I-E CRISPR-associated endoribonuclease Cas2 [Chloroflexi bacterium]|nr:type I-E CRISPR-associated endoribonuclease Cas2 [Chloroflexota bacterium]
MVIMILEKVPPSVRGELSRWLIQVRTGVYIGHVNARVRDKLWEKCVEARRAGSVFQAWSTNNEQHFSMRLEGDNDRQVVDMEGLQFVLVKKDALTAAQKRRIRRKKPGEGVQ